MRPGASGCWCRDAHHHKHRALLHTCVSCLQEEACSGRRCMHALGAQARASWPDSPLKAPGKAEEEEEDWRGGLAHGVERQRDQRQRKIGQPDVQASGCAIGHDCTSHISLHTHAVWTGHVAVTCAQCSSTIAVRVVLMWSASAVKDTGRGVMLHTLLEVLMP